MHPGFAIASTPVIIFLAFAIILLSALVIYLLARKFKNELRVLQGQGTTMHDQEVSQFGTMVAAVNMGMSTMRRRPTRTTLTAVTVVMLTFTILSFASFNIEIGVRKADLGAVDRDMPQAILLRNLDFAVIESGNLVMLEGQQGPEGLLAPGYWLVGEGDSGSQGFPVSRGTAAEEVGAVMGVDPRQLERWPALAVALGATPDTAQALSKSLASDGLLLPEQTAERLGLKPGDKVRLRGRPATFAGAFDVRALQRLRHIDGESALPVDFSDPSAAQEESSGVASDEAESLLVDDVQKDFVHLSANAMAVAGNSLVRQVGGELHTITLHPDPSINAVERGERLAELVVMPVWAPGPDGVQRMLLTQLTSVSGSLQLVVPLLLGGLIIFGTLLGSISDREKEIYTFSALGLSPLHVGLLFFAEAAVYAIVGGMGGQLLAQVVSVVAGALAQQGLIPPPNINYSSTNSLFAIGVVMATVMVSAIYPATRASKSANPGLARSWNLPKPDGDDLILTFPFTVSAYDMTGVASFLAEHFRRHDDPGLGAFAAQDIDILRDNDNRLVVSGEFALAPFDLGVTQRMELKAIPSEIPGVDEVNIKVTRLSGTTGDWTRANRTFMKHLRKQFLLWRTLPDDTIEQFRMETLQTLGERPAPTVTPDPPMTGLGDHPPLQPA